jgi:hypothetical protein
MGDGRTVGPREAMEPLRRHKKYSAEKWIALCKDFTIIL